MGIGGFMFGIGMQELLIILVLVLIVFGAKRLPEIGGGLGKAIRNFKQGATEPDEIDISNKKAKMENIEDKKTESVSTQKEKINEKD